MTSQVKTIFLAEGEKDIFARLREQGIDTEVFAHKFQHLFQKIYNNEVGYYSFMQQGSSEIYRFVVLPKTIDIKDENKETAFVNYLLHYYRVNNLYRFDKTKKIPNSILSLAFESNNKKDRVHSPLELFEYFKTEAILKSIEAFFQKHKHYQRVEQNYISQSTKHKLNLSKNIKEIDKTKIHQSRKVDILYSKIATVSYFALKRYLQKTANNEKLKRYANKVCSLIARKYAIDKGFSLSLPMLYGHRVARIFQKKDEYKILLANLRSLFGYEQLHNEMHSLAELRHDLYTNSFFIKPDLFYEWYVYDILKQYVKENRKKIQFDKKEGTSTKYKLNDEDKSSNPDYILTDENVKIVIDAKWKNIDKFGDIKAIDYLKLKFDTSLIEKQGYGVVSYLVYPKIGIEDRKFHMQMDESSLFKFNIIGIDMEFINKENSLSFKYDFDAISDEMKKEKSQEFYAQKAKEITQIVQVDRDKVIQDLIKANSSEEKEELGGLFDETLWRQSEELVKQLDVEIILEEVDELLQEFDTVMEEESKTFLKSTSTIYAHYKDEKGIAFDFSMPGSGLWKFIEVELNTSFVWQLRIMSGVCDSQSPWKKICKKNAKIDQTLDSGKKVPLSISAKKDKSILQSVMLGGIKLLLEDKSTLEEFGSFFNKHDNDKNFIHTDLPSTIEQVVIFRNEHAHIKAMSKETFEDLWNLLFQKDHQGYNQLQKLLLFKQRMKEYIDA